MSNQQHLLIGGVPVSPNGNEAKEDDQDYDWKVSHPSGAVLLTACGQSVLRVLKHCFFFFSTNVNDFTVFLCMDVQLVDQTILAQ